MFEKCGPFMYVPKSFGKEYASHIKQQKKSIKLQMRQSLNTLGTLIFCYKGMQELESNILRL